MKPGERVRLVEESATSLATRPWLKIQLILRTFGVETYELDTSWHGGPNDEIEYCYERLAETPDETLLAIHQHIIGEDAAASAPVVGTSPWGNLPARLFISHIYQFRHGAGQIKSQLGTYYGIDAFVAHDDIKPSATWRGVIKNALATCNAFVALLDPGFHDSQWCDQEVGWALSRDIPIIPIRDRNTDRKAVRDGFLEEKQDFSFDNTDKYVSAAIAWEVFRIVVEDPRSQHVGVNALVEAFVKSTSYDTTRQLWRMVVAQPVLDSDHLRRLEFAVQTNDQVYNAISTERTPIPQLVKELVLKLEPPPQRWGDEEPF